MDEVFLEGQFWEGLPSQHRKNCCLLASKYPRPAKGREPRSMGPDGRTRKATHSNKHVMVMLAFGMLILKTP